MDRPPPPIFETLRNSSDRGWFHSFRHLHRDHMAAGADFPVRAHRRIDHDLAALDLPNRAPDFQWYAQWRRAEIIDVERRRYETQGRQGIHWPPLHSVGGCCRRPRAMTIDERSDQTAINIAGDSGMVGTGRERSDRFLAVPVALELIPVGVEPATAVAMAQFIGIVILKGSGVAHRIFCFSGSGTEQCFEVTQFKKSGPRGLPGGNLSGLQRILGVLGK